MSTLSDLVRSRRESGQGVFGSLSSSLKDKIKESIDPRRFLNQTGLLTALFPKLKSFKAQTIRKDVGKIENNLSDLTLEMLQKTSEISAKNSMVLPAMHRDINVMRQNIVKLVKLDGEKPATKVDAWFRKQKFRESEYEQKISSSKETKKPTKTRTKKPSSEVTPTTGKSLISSMTGGIKSLPMGKVAAGVAVGAATGLTALTAKGESRGGDYNIVVGGSKQNLTNMSLGEVLSFQDDMRKSKKYPSTAVGKYQIIQSTLKDAIKNLNLNLSDKFDENMQEKIFKEYLIGKKRKGISHYLMGKVPDTPENLQKAQMDLALEFASYGVPRDVSAGEFNGYPKRDIKRGQSMYAGVAGNKASISPEKSAIALKQDRMRNEGKVVVPHPGTTPTGVPVPQQVPKMDGNKLEQSSSDVKREKEKPLVKESVVIKEQTNNVTTQPKNNSSVQPEDYSKYIEERMWS